MFEFNGALIDQSKGWKIIYTDDEGDIMMLGDYPWQLSIKCHICIYIYIYYISKFISSYLFVSSCNAVLSAQW